MRLHYAEQGDQMGEALIFLHGYSDSWYSFSQVLPLLSPEYHAFAFDQRGYGDSDKPECCYTLDDFAADVGGVHGYGWDRGSDPRRSFGGTMPYTEARKLLDEDYPEGWRYYWKSVNVNSFDEEVLERLMAHAEAAPSDHSTIDAWYQGGLRAGLGPRIPLSATGARPSYSASR